MFSSGGRLKRRRLLHAIGAASLAAATGSFFKFDGGKSSAFFILARATNLPVTVDIYTKHFFGQGLVPGNEKFHEIRKKISAEGRLESFEKTEWGFQYKFKNFSDYRQWTNLIFATEILPSRIVTKYDLLFKSATDVRLVNRIDFIAV